LHGQQPVFLKDFDEVSNIRIRYDALDSKLAGEMFRDLGRRQALFDEFKDSRPDIIETEHLSVKNVQDGSPVGAVRCANMLGDPQHVFLRSWASDGEIHGGT
jgi:hypothetical protein